MAKKWETESDFDNQVDQSGVAHESVTNTDHQDGGEITMGYQYNDAQSLHPILSNLTAWWPLHTKAGNVVDLSGNGNNGSRTGTVKGVPGKGGLKAHSFDGLDDYITAPSTSIGTSKDFTVVAWCRPSSFPNTNNYIFSREGVNSGIILRCDGSGVPYGYVHDGAYQAVSGNAMPTDEWQMVAFTCANNSEIELYQNTTKQATTAIGDRTEDTSNNEVQIGARQVASSDPYEYIWSGVLCDVMYFDKVLSSSEIQTLYDWHHGDYAEPPDNDNGGVSYYPLDEDSGTTANDPWASNNGSVSGATVGVKAVRDTGYDFDGTDDYVDMGDIFDLSTLTTSAWFRPRNAGTTDERLVMSGNEEWGLQVRNNYLRGLVRYADDSATITVDSDPVLTNGEWYHGVLTYDGATAAVYINGELHATVNDSNGTNSDTASFRIGARSDGIGFFTGRVDDVRVYNRALEQWEVQELYQYGTRGRDMRDLTVIA